MIWESQKWMLSILSLHLRFDYFNMGLNGVRITERHLYRLAGIRFKPNGIYCELDERDNCEHIGFALTVPEAKEISRDKRKGGWKLPDLREIAHATTHGCGLLPVSPSISEELMIATSAKQFY